MAPQKSDEVRSALGKVWLNSRPEALERLATLEHFTETLRSGTPDRDACERALSAAHRLSGSLGMFGFDEASFCAAEIEGLLSAGRTPDAAAMAGLVGRLGKLLEATRASSGKTERHDS